KAHVGNDPPLERNNVVLHEHTKETFHDREFDQQLFHRLPCEVEQLTIFKGFNVIHRILTRCETSHVGYPPAFNGELDYMFVAFVVDCEGTQQSFFDKGDVLADVAGVQEILTLAEFLWYEVWF